MNEMLGVLAAMLSSAIGGSSVAATRYVVGATDPMTLGALRFGIGFLGLLPIALLQSQPWPPRRDWPAAAGLGALFFGLFPILFNASLIFTTAARGALALSTLPLLTMLAAALLRVEMLTPRKSLGVGIAMAGVALALLTGLATAPAGAWRGDLLMVGAALCMALYSVWSRPFIKRSGPVTFTTMGMAVGALGLIAISAASGGLQRLSAAGTAQWLAFAYVGLAGSTLAFFLWSFALGRTTPTRVAISVTVNPVIAAITGAVLLGEAVGWNVVAGLAAVLAGIWIATTGRR
ncbi:DMT family transporter [Bosea caraganae]|uniref:DMT family transporter n=1 Tax=Bosea caraganae TaxID=2763117 RepID=A0A370L5D6_9HYPH|nr:DMT family transporter [Bosea caraganae]RDJ24292.1 DMT family transporter [Bosea caraganae]RDJ30335.1 DMT family transporter [Bosea caraganae]